MQQSLFPLLPALFVPPGDVWAYTTQDAALAAAPRWHAAGLPARPIDWPHDHFDHADAALDNEAWQLSAPRPVILQFDAQIQQKGTDDGPRK